MERESFGKELRRVRRRLDLTQEQAAERAGLTLSIFAKYEIGERFPPLRICSVGDGRKSGFSKTCRRCH